MSLQFEDAGKAGAGRIRIETALPVYSLTLFLSAFLLFSVQPFFAKMVLPKLGGSPAVWSVAMVFFQSMLLLGYGYAHLLTRLFFPARGALIHLCLMLLAFVALPIAIPASWNEVPNTGQTIWLIGLFAVSVGLPFFAVSANGPLLQAWFAQTGHRHADDPYFLYGASNIGSFASLFLYILFFEPLFTVRGQSALWTGGFVLLGLMIAACSLFVLGRKRQQSDAHASAKPEDKILQAPSTSDRVSWIWLASIPSAMLVAVTSFISTDVASAPFLWVIPLALFLATFVIVFARKPIIPQSWVEMALMPAAIVVLVMYVVHSHFPIWLNIFLHYGFFFLAALAAHGAMAARRPATSHLTEFYFLMSVGGLVGGIFASLVAPNIFKTVAEYPLLIVVSMLSVKQVIDRGPRVGILVFMAACAFVIVFNDLHNIIPLIFLSLLLGNLAGFLAIQHKQYQQAGILLALTIFAVGVAYQHNSPTFQDRSFFGVTTIFDSPDGKFRLLRHGTTIHGAVAHGSEPGQLDSDRPEPLTYYHDKAGMPRAIMAMRERRGGKLENVGVVGLGSGSLACYRQRGENWDFYEIDQLMVDIALDTKAFGFVPKCAPDAPMIVGDARLMLQKQPQQKYDLLIIDAFSSDSIPVHLLTVEALELYRSRMASDGLLVLHISNRHMDLAPFIAANAHRVGALAFHANFGHIGENTRRNSSDVVYIVNKDDELGSLLEEKAVTRLNKTDISPWTDDYSNILAAIMAKRH